MSRCEESRLRVAPAVELIRAARLAFEKLFGCIVIPLECAEQS